MMTGGRTTRVLAVVWLGVAGCWKENPAYHATMELATGGDDGASSSSMTSAALVPETTSTSTSTTDGETTAVDPSAAATTTTTTGTTSIEPPPGATTTTTTTGDTADGETTADGVAPACGASGYGPVEMLGRQWFGVVPQACADIPGRNFLVLGAQGEFVEAIACSTDPVAGCVSCDALKGMQFVFHTPEPAGAIPLSKCVYLAAHGAMEPEQPGPCRFKQMAVWWDGSNKPGKAPPLALLGHDTLSADPDVAAVTGAALSLELVPTNSECSCVDAEDCCPDKAVEYQLRFVTEGEAVAVGPGQHAPLGFDGATYDAYNGQSHETGACAQEQRFDWWLLRK